MVEKTGKLKFFIVLVVLDIGADYISQLDRVNEQSE